MHIIGDIKENFSHYLVLLFILTFGALAFFFFRQIPQKQIVSVFLTATFYVFWGVIHHYLKGDLHLRIVLEYIAVALLGFIIIWNIVARV